MIFWHILVLNILAILIIDSQVLASSNQDDQIDDYIYPFGENLRVGYTPINRAESLFGKHLLSGTKSWDSTIDMQSLMSDPNHVFEVGGSPITTVKVTENGIITLSGNLPQFDANNPPPYQGVKTLMVYHTNHDLDEHENLKDHSWDNVPKLEDTGVFAGKLDQSSAPDLILRMKNHITTCGHELPDDFDVLWAIMITWLV